ncbi:MAG: hypothetical protein ACW98K_12990, partial [Candidatus Kariarchaeaceae archaeon]
MSDTFMKAKYTHKILTVTIFCLFLGTGIQQAMGSSLPNTPVTLNENGYQPQQLGSSLPTQPLFSLKELVEKLTPVTENTTDSDGDGIYDTIEDVIGLDSLNPDTDLDNIDDYTEINFESNPLEADSNFDGVPDNYELSNPLSDTPPFDLDQDGMSNLWDFDNDNDGVNDAVDLSPFAKTVVTDSIQLAIQSNSNPLHVTFQLIPENQDHLQLIHRYWDWPYDTVGNMKDLHKIPDKDVRASPLLKLSMDNPPAQNDVEQYGITITPDGVYIPLYPVIDYGSIVAFTGKFVYPASVPNDLLVDAELVWNIYGQNDEAVVGIKGENDAFLSVQLDQGCYLNATVPSLMETFQWISVGDDTVALKLYNGPYLSVNQDGYLEASGLDIGENETFEIVQTGETFALQSLATDGYLTMDDNKALVANASDVVDATQFLLENLEPRAETSLLVTYTEEFMLTGLVAEEQYGSDLGIFYSTDINQTLAAELLLSIDFLRNSTITIPDLPDILDQNSLALYKVYASFEDRDSAISSMNNQILPDIIDSLPQNQPLPFIITIEDRIEIVDMSDLSLSSYELGSSIPINLANPSYEFIRTMRTSWYNNSQDDSRYTALDIMQIAQEIFSWNLDIETTDNIIALMICWDIGEQYTLGENEDVSSEPLREIIIDFVKQGVKLRKMYKKVKSILKTFNTGIKFVRGIGEGLGKSLFSTEKSLFAIGKSYKSVAASGAGKISKWAKFGKGLQVAAFMLDIGLAIYGVISISTSGLSGMELNSALLRTLMQYVLMLTLTALSSIPIFAFLIAIFSILDMIFGWTDKLFTAIIDAISKVEAESQPMIDVVGDLNTNIFDFDNNGLDVGDRIELSGLLLGLAYGSDEDLAQDSTVLPYYNIIPPFGSNSQTGTLHPERNILPNDEGGYWRAPVPGKNQWTTVDYTENDDYYSGQQYESGAWIEPGIPMVNFPVIMQIDLYSRLYYRWTHFAFFGFYWFWCDHDDHHDSIQTVGDTPVYFDVFPATIDDFADWGMISPLDYDGDGIPNNEEFETNVLKYDTDGDKLNDLYEQEIGTDPLEPDSDYDGIDDKIELVYDTDPMNPDSDEDGLRDYLEIAGDKIQFNYQNDPSLSFTIQV